MYEHPIFREFRGGKLPRLVMTHVITAEHSAEHARLQHLHEDMLELFYVAQGSGEYEVGRHPYYVQCGDMIICNAGVLHGEEPAAKRKILSYCISLTDVALYGLPDNYLLPLDAYPIIPCGRLSGKIGEIMQLLTMFSADLQALGPICDSLSCGILLMLLGIARSGSHRTPPSKIDDAIAKRIKTYLDQHYSAPLSLERIGHALNISPSYLSHVFKKEYGEAPMQYLYKRRIGEAQSLLIDTDTPIGEIADRLCYGTINHFNTVFKKYVGITPGRYRKSFKTMDSDEKGV